MYLLLVLVGLSYGAVYVSVYLLEVPGATTERFGKRLPLPLLGRWQVESGTDAARQAIGSGLIRETRLVSRDPLDADNGYLLRQVRYRSRTSGRIVRFEAPSPERWPRQFVE